MFSDVHLAHAVLTTIKPADPPMIVMIVVALVETDMRSPLTTSPRIEDMAVPVLVLNLERPVFTLTA